MADFHFLRPYWLITLLPAFLFCWSFLRSQDRVDKWRELIDPHLLQHLLIGEHKKSWLSPSNVLLGGWLMAAIALAGPTWQKELSPFQDDEAGLMILLKVSETMKSTDVQPSRLERAKLKIRDLLALRQGAATGLIVYSGSAHLVMPLTRDDRIINSMLEDLTPDLMPAEGDALGQALQKAKHILNQTGIPGSFLVVTDIVSPARQAALRSNESSTPVQFLSMQPPNAPLDPGLKNVSDSLGGSIVRLSVDQSDVEQVNYRAKTKFASVTGHAGGERWRDSGYFFLFPTAICILMLFRRGWVLR